MPDEESWAGFFDIKQILSGLQINSGIKDLVEIGCGYGTFTIPAAMEISGTLFAFDIEKEMIESARQKVIANNLDNVILEQRDILTRTTGLADSSVDYAMLFNILHHDAPVDFLTEALRILKINGKVGIIHWRSDIPTPRGPDLSIRPRPEQIINWIDKLNLNLYKGPVIISPYHYGLILLKV